MKSPPRVQLSKKKRFDVFKRDGFVCQYCGATPPNVVLHVDHIDPVKEGGTNDPDNLATSCSACNLGKGAIELSVVPPSLEEKASIIQERESQLMEYNRILTSAKQRRDNDIWHVAQTFIERFGDDGITHKRFGSIRRFLDDLALVEVHEAMETACYKLHSRGEVFRYFCGICWRLIKERRGE